MAQTTEPITVGLLEKLDTRIFEQMHLESASPILPWAGGSAERWQEYENAVKGELERIGISQSSRIPDSVRRRLESDNYHSLNQAIDFLGYGEGRYGLNASDFFKGDVPTSHQITPEVVMPKPREPRIPLMLSTKDGVSIPKSQVLGYARRLENLSRSFHKMSLALKKAVEEEVKALKNGDLELARDIASVAALVTFNTNSKERYTEEFDRHDEKKRAKTILLEIANALRPKNGKPIAGDLLEWKDSVAVYQLPKSKNPTVRSIATQFKRSMKQQRTAEVRYKANEIKEWKKELREVEGKTDKESVARRTIAEAGLKQAQGKITYNQFAKIRDSKRLQDTLHGYYERQREKERKKRRAESQARLKKGREFVSSDSGARFVYAFQPHYGKVSVGSEEFKDEVAKFKAEAPLMGLRLESSHVVGLVTNPTEFNEKWTVDEPTTLRFDRKKLRELLKAEGGSQVKFGGSVYGTKMIEDALKVLDVNDPIRLQTVRSKSAVNPTIKPIMLTDANGQSIVIAPRVTDSAGSASGQTISEMKSLNDLGTSMEFKERTKAIKDDIDKQIAEMKSEGVPGYHGLPPKLTGNYVGEVYRNGMTGNEFKVVKQDKKKGTLTLKGAGMEFETTPALMGNYSYVGRKFSDQKKKVPRHHVSSSQHHAPKHRKAPKRVHHRKTQTRRSIRKTKNGKVKPHPRIRDTCVHCGGNHSSNVHRFHGKHSFERTHGKREEKML